MSICAFGRGFTALEDSADENAWAITEVLRVWKEATRCQSVWRLLSSETLNSFKAFRHLKILQ